MEHVRITVYHHIINGTCTYHCILPYSQWNMYISLYITIQSMEHVHITVYYPIVDGTCTYHCILPYSRWNMTIGEYRVIHACSTDYRRI